MNTNGTDWASIIGSANQAALAWYQATRTPPISGQQIGVQASIGPGTVQANASMSAVLVGAVVIVALILVLKS